MTTTQTENKAETQAHQQPDDVDRPIAPAEEAEPGEETGPIAPAEEAEPGEETGPIAPAEEAEPGEQPATLSEEADDEIPHLPDPSICPIVIAFGVCILFYGIVLNLLLVLVGLMIVVAGIAGWIYQDIQVAKRGEHH